jgi:hypothetical protein
VVGYGKEIGFAFACLYATAIFPQFFIGGLHHVPGVFFVTQVLEDKTINVIRI